MTERKVWVQRFAVSRSGNHRCPGAVTMEIHCKSESALLWPRHLRALLAPTAPGEAADLRPPPPQPQVPALRPPRPGRLHLTPARGLSRAASRSNAEGPRRRVELLQLRFPAKQKSLQPGVQDSGRSGPGHLPSAAGLTFREVPEVQPSAAG